MKRSSHSREASGAALSFLTWNILREGRSPLASGWSKRRDSFRQILGSREFDIVCLQEVLPGQLGFFQDLFPRHDFHGVGRDDGKSGGEHCPIFFDRERFALGRCGTFWLSPTPEIPSTGWGEAFPRLCGWVELEDRFTGRAFRVSNLHLQLLPFAQSRAAVLLAEQLGGHGLPRIVAGDFNGTARSPGVRRLVDGGLKRVAGEPRATFHLRGIPLRTLDHILTSPDWNVGETKLLNQPAGGIFPSDHFGLSARMSLA